MHRSILRCCNWREREATVSSLGLGFLFSHGHPGLIACLNEVSSRRGKRTNAPTESQESCWGETGRNAKPWARRRTGRSAPRRRTGPSLPTPADGDARCPSTDGMVELGSVSLSALALGRARDDDGGDDGGRGGDDCSDASSCDDPFGDLGGGDVPSPSPGTPSLNLLGRRYSLPADAREVDSARRSLCYLTYRSGLAVPLVP
ncbi:hypothetical protein THAOC_18964, partial [Thalassiosira oceanica]